MMPAIIHLAIRKKLYENIKIEVTNNQHRAITNLGGVAIFAAIRITNAIFIDIPEFPANYLSATMFILFLVGINDDLIGVRPMSRLLAQFIVALIMIIPGDLRFHTLDGFLGIDELSTPLSIVITAIFIVGIINSFNLIDGIDGLAGTLGLIGSFVFAYLFYLSGSTGLALFSLAIFGALVGFLIYNISPAKIFMGDSGAYLVGFLMAVFSIVLVNQVYTNAITVFSFPVNSAIGIVASLLMIPVFDTLRVFFLRIIRRAHPFKGDNNHIHHRLLNMGFSHRQVVLILGSITVGLLILSVSLQHLNIGVQLLIIFVVTFIFNVLCFLVYQKQVKALIT